MQTNRRLWLKQISLGVAGIGLTGFKTVASTAGDLYQYNAGNLPVRLSSNENPYGPSPLARTAMAKHIGISNRYNWELTADLTEALAIKNNVPAENILMGAGSTEIIDLVVRCAALEKGSFIIADPGYSYWTDAAQKSGLKKIAVPLTAGKKHDLAAMLNAVQPDTKMIYICNPNNPTGTTCDRNQLVQFINEATKKAIVLVDEAYIDFTSQPSLNTLTIENTNLVIAKTFSKIYGLAGARVGYAIGNARTIEKLSALQTWVNGSISVASAAAARASLRDDQFVANTYALNEKARKYTIEQLEKLNLECIPSAANFIYFSLNNYKKNYFVQLKRNNITGTRIYEEEGQWTRITVGTTTEMQQFIRAIA